MNEDASHHASDHTEHTSRTLDAATRDAMGKVAYLAHMEGLRGRVRVQPGASPAWEELEEGTRDLYRATAAAVLDALPTLPG